MFTDEINPLFSFFLELLSSTVECFSLVTSSALPPCRFDEAVKSAQRHATPSEDRPTGVHWPWWVQAQASFLKGDLQQVHPSC